LKFPTKSPLVKKQQFIFRRPKALQQLFSGATKALVSLFPGRVDVREWSDINDRAVTLLWCNMY
jgi:hypothetical protein